MLESAPEEAASVQATDSSGQVELARMDVQTRAGESRAGPLADDLAQALQAIEAPGMSAMPTSNNIHHGRHHLGTSRFAGSVPGNHAAGRNAASRRYLLGGVPAAASGGDNDRPGGARGRVDVRP